MHASWQSAYLSKLSRLSWYDQKEKVGAATVIALLSSPELVTEFVTGAEPIEEKYVDDCFLRKPPAVVLWGRTRFG